jgi:hypothetical protein
MTFNVLLDGIIFRYCSAHFNEFCGAKKLLAPKGSSADIYKIPVGAEHLIMPPK